MPNQTFTDRNFKPPRRQLPVIALLALSLVIAVGAFLWFRSENYRRIVAQNTDYIQEYTTQEAKQIERNLENAKTLLLVMANQYSTLSSSQQDRTARELLRAVYDNRLFNHICFVSPDGVSVNADGKTEQVSDQTYFQRAMQGETGYQAVADSDNTQRPSLAFYTPVFRENEMVGVLIGIYDKEHIEELFLRELFHDTPHSYLLAEDGTIVASSEGAGRDGNVFHGLEQEAANYQKVMDFIHSSTQGSLSFTLGTAARPSEGTIVKFEQSDWMLMNVLPTAGTSNMIAAANHTGWVFEAVLIAVFLLYLMVVIGTYRRQRIALQDAVVSATKELNETLAEERQQRAIIGTLASIYSHAYFFNLQTMEYLILRHKHELVFAIPEQGNITEALKKYVDQLILPSSQEAMREFVDVTTLQQRLAGADTISAEYQRHDGKWCRGTFVVANRGGGQIQNVVYAVQLIDEEKQKALDTQAALRDACNAAQMASDAKTAFLANMSHDMRTPMNAIIGMTAIAGAHLDDRERVMECLNKIAASSKHLLALINEVLDMGKIEAGKIDLNEEEFSLSELVENMLTLNHPLITAHHHTVTVELHDVQSEQVLGDGVRLQQVFSNLLSNAAKYTPDGGTIKIGLTERTLKDADAAWFELTVQDNGIGMSEEFQQKIFEPFARADDERVNAIQGTGLGMSITRNLIRMMNGDITVKSALGEGTTFTVTFYLKVRKEPDLTYPEFIDLPVLVADDDQISCESICSVLDSLGMRSEWVLSAEEAVEKIIHAHEVGNDYYAVMLDWKMPGIGGIGAAHQIRTHSDIPIVIVSAYDWSDIEQEAQEAGVSAFVAKPLFKSRACHLFHELMGKEPARKKQDTLQEMMEQHDFTGKRVLLVEDNALNAEIAIEILEMTHLTVETAANGRIAVEKIAAAEPGYYDLVLMDVQMPVMNGYEATKAIREMEREDLKTLPIVAMTANTFASDVQTALQAGMNGHIAKPLELDRLNKMLRQFLAG